MEFRSDSTMQKAVRSALVSTQWLRDVVIAKPGNYRILDSAWHLPNTGRKAAEEYKHQHIPGALYFDIDDCADKSTGLSHTIPSVEVFENYVGNLGINNDTHVIVYDNNPQFPIFSAQRAWWTFRLFGHEKISVLNGGLQKWIKENGLTTSEVQNVPKQKFNANFQPHLVKKYEDIESNIKNQDFQLADARPAPRFNGTGPEPRADIKPGCIPNSLNIPFTTTFDLDKQCMKSADELKKLFDEGGVDFDKPLAVTCGSGISACILALAAFECGNENLAVYDGSWTEWFLKAPNELKQNVPSD